MLHSGSVIAHQLLERLVQAGGGQAADHAGQDGAVVLGEYPVAPLPISPDFLTVAGLLIFLHQQIRTSPQQSHGILLQYP